MDDDETGFKLPFAWADLKEERAYSPRTSSSGGCWRLPFDPPAGSLAAIFQRATYGGLLCGRPERREDNETYVMDAVREAMSLFGVSGAVQVVPPVLHVGELRRVKGPPRPVVLLPPVCSLGLFQSGPVEPEEDEGSSRIAVVWFQDGFGLPEANIVTTGS